MKSIEDIFYPILKVYNGLPLPIRNFIGSIYRKLPKKFKYGSFYYEYKQRINEFENSSYELKILKQEKLLIAQVNRAIKSIPFYSKHVPIKTVSELDTLPIIQKEDISENISAFHNEKEKEKSLKSNTGGSSGTPFSFYIEKGITRPKEAAHFNWYWNKYSFKEGDRVLMLRGKALKNNAKFEYQSIHNKLVVSCYNVGQDDLEDIYKQIIKFKPEFIHAYPSALLSFTKELEIYLKDKPFDLEIKTIFLGSEKVFKRDEEFLGKFYNSKVVNWYGHSECLIHAARCDISGDYHFFPFYGFLELIDENDQQINDSGIEGRIVATGFDNSVMPLIRYDTGDLGAYSANKECECGFKGRSLSSISGRSKDYIYLNDKTKVSLTAFIFGQHHKEFEKIKELQVTQSKHGEILLKVLPLNEFTGKDKFSFKKNLIKSVDHKLLVEIEVVKEIEKTHRGKHTLLKQYIKE